MLPKNPPITHERVKELVVYNPETGVFINRISRGKARQGMPCGGKSDVNGYIRFVLDGYFIYANRLAWFYVYGVWPSGEADHINRIKKDNRIQNLRDVTHNENMANRARSGRPNKVGLKGVRISKEGNRFVAQINTGGKCLHLGSFKEAGHAGAAYRIAAAALGNA